MNNAGGCCAPTPTIENKKSTTYARQERAGEQYIEIVFPKGLWDIYASNTFVIIELWLKFIEDKFLRVTHSIVCIYKFSFKRRLHGTRPLPFFCKC